MFFIPFIIVIFLLFFFRNNFIAITMGIISIGMLNSYWYDKMTWFTFLHNIVFIHIPAIISPDGYLYPLLFLVGIGILLDLFQDLHILESYKILMERLFHNQRKIALSVTVITSSIYLFFLDDYLVILGIKNFFNSLYNDNNKYELATYSSILGASTAAIFMSTWTGIILTQITKLANILHFAISPMEIFLRSKQFFLFPKIAILTLIFYSIFFKSDRKSLIQSQTQTNDKIIKINLILFLVFPISILAIFFYYLYFLQINIADCNIALMLCQGLGISFIINSLILFIFKTISIKFILKRAIKSTSLYLKPILSMILCWLFSRLMTELIIIEGSAFHNINLIPNTLLPFLFFLISTIISAILGSEWTTIALTFPLISLINAQTIHSIAINIGAIISGTLAGSQLSPISNTNITTSTIFEINSILFYKKKLKLIIIITLITGFAFLASSFIF